jgi:predicted RNase H-like nuclease (RuvC/YqgF family)
MGEEGYMNKNYCLECGTKHINRLEHHLEDLQTATRDDPEMRKKAQDMLDQIRDLRKELDQLRIEQLRDVADGR